MIFINRVLKSTKKAMRRFSFTAFALRCNRLFFSFISVFLGLVLTTGITAQPQPRPETSSQVRLGDGNVLKESPVWVVSYIEVHADAAVIDSVSGIIAEHSNLSSDVKGSLWNQAIQRIGRTNHFALIQVWSDLSGFNAYKELADTVQFHQKIEPYLYSPYDQRVHFGLDLDPDAFGSVGDESVFVLTHADVLRNQQFSSCSLGLPKGYPDAVCGNQLLMNQAQDSREHKGNLRFDLLTQISRTNHMTVFEIWANGDAQREHLSNQQTVAFRYALSGLEKIDSAEQGMVGNAVLDNGSMLGSLWDERVYLSL